MDLQFITIRHKEINFIRLFYFLNMLNIDDPLFSFRL